MSQRLTKEHKNIPPSLNPSHRSTELATKSREGEFPRPLWERIKVRGIIVSITIVHRFRIRIILLRNVLLPLFLLV